MTDRNEQEAVDPVVLEVFATEDQPTTQMKKSIPKTKTQLTASITKTTSTGSGNKDSSNESEQGEPLDEESVENPKRLPIMPFRIEESYLLKQPEIYKRKTIATEGLRIQVLMTSFKGKIAISGAWDRN